VTCALAYDKARRREGWSGVIRRSLRRGWDIYAAFLLLTLACAIMVYLAGRDHLADDSNTRILLEHPGATLAHAAILQYRPVNTDVLPIFVIYHVLFAPLLWLLLRAPNVTLGASLLLYSLVHVFGWSVPAWPNDVWYFNPLAWQLLIVLGAWCVIEGKKFRPWVTSRTALVLAVLYLVFSLIIALSCSVKPLEPLVPQTLTKLLFPLDKSNLCPLRLLHFLALAIVAVRFVPQDWRRAVNAGDALREALWRELAANLLHRRSPGARQPPDADRHLGSARDADVAQPRWNPGDDRRRDVAELDQHQTRAAAPVDAADGARYRDSLEWVGLRTPVVRQARQNPEQVAQP